jgi:hypothetical protein
MTITYYSEDTFAIDLVRDAYKIKHPVKIAEKVKEVLDIHVSVSQVMDYLNYTEDFESTSNSISMKDLFDEKRV